MRLLITGVSGLLGLNLALEARKVHQIFGVDRRKLVNVPFELVEADLLEPGTVDSILDTVRPDWLIHCAALANLETCEAEPDLARRLNAILPGELAAACKTHGVRMLHISTDSVFDGTSIRPYTESDQPNPLGVYSETKFQGERIVLESNPGVIVARVNFYGFSLSGKRSLAEFLVNNLSAGKPVNGFTDVTFCPTFVGDLANLLLAMLAKDLHGLYHVVSKDCMSKYDFCVAIAHRFEWDSSLISPQSVDRSELTARRSHNLYLSIQKLSADLGTLIPTFSTGLERFYTQYQQGYPQKIRGYQQEA